MMATLLDQAKGRIETSRRNGWRGPVILFLGVFALFIAAQWTTLEYCWRAWSEKDGYYSHGLLVPILAAYMLWQNRHALLRSRVRPNMLALPALVIVCLASIFGRLYGVPILCSISFVLQVYFLVKLLLGDQVLTIARPVVFFLITMLPLSESLLDRITNYYQYMSATFAMHMLHLVDSSIVQEANTLISDNLPGPMVVGAPCSGLRLLIALITCSWFFAYILKGAKWKKLLLVAISLPLSMLINSIRIALIGGVGIYTASVDAMHSFHDYSGYVSLAICTVLLLLTSRVLGLSAASSPDPEPVAATRSAWAGPGRGLTGITIGLLLLQAVILGTIAPVYSNIAAPVNSADMPFRFGGWVGTDVAIDADTKRMLSTATLLSRVYRNESEMRPPVQVFVEASYDSSAFHEPRVCLPRGGDVITDETGVRLDLGLPGLSNVHATLMRTTDDYGSRTALLSWYMIGDQTAATRDELMSEFRQLKVDNLKQALRNPMKVGTIRANVRDHKMVWYRLAVSLNDEDTDIQSMREFAKSLVRSITNRQKYGIL